MNYVSRTELGTGLCALNEFYIPGVTHSAITELLCVECWGYRHGLPTQEAHRQAHSTLPASEVDIYFSFLMGEERGSQSGEIVGPKLHR